MSRGSRKPLDWDRIHLDYETGQFSIRELARLHSCNDKAIRKRMESDAAKGKPWVQRLAERVEARTEEILVRASSYEAAGDCFEIDAAEAAKVLGITEQEAVNQAAMRGAAVVLSHRSLAHRLRNVTIKMLGELESGRVTCTKADGDKIIEVTLPMDAKEKAVYLKEIAAGVAKFVPIERQAFNLDRKNAQASDVGGVEIHAYYGGDDNG